MEGRYRLAELRALLRIVSSLLADGQRRTNPSSCSGNALHGERVAEMLPTLTDLTDHIRVGYAHILEEDLIGLGNMVGRGVEVVDTDARSIVWYEEQCDAAVRPVGTAPCCDEDQTSRKVRERREHLGAVNNPVAPVSTRDGIHVGCIRSPIRLG